MKKIISNEWVLFALLLVVFVSIEYPSLARYDASDQNIYFYSAKLVSEGVMPYRDFVFAHPPLHVFILGAVYKIFGFNVFILKCVPLGAIAFASLFMFLLMKYKFGKYEGLASVFLFLLSFNILEFSTYALGISLTVMFLAIGLYFFEKQDLRYNFILSGLFIGLAGLTGLYSIPVILAFMLVLFFSKSSSNNKKDFLTLILSYGIVFILVNALALLLFGFQYIDQVFLYHLMKESSSSETASIFFDVIKMNLPVIIASLLLVFCNEKKRLNNYVIAAGIYLVFLLFLSRIFKYYFVILVFLLAIIGGYTIVNLAGRIEERLGERTRERKGERSIGRSRERLKRAGSSIFVVGMILLVIIFVLIGAKELIVLFSPFQNAEEIAFFIKERTDQNDEIYGESVVTPLIALLADRDIALHQADTNLMVFNSGIVDLDEAISNLKKSRLKYVVARPFFGIGSNTDFVLFLRDNCNMTKSFTEKYQADFFVFECDVQ